MRFKKLNEMTDEELNKELKKWSLFSAVVLVMLGGSLYALKKVNNDEEKDGKTTKNRLADDNDKLYRMDIDEKYLDNVIWIDNEGKTTNKTYIDSSKDVQVVSLEKDINKNENYFMFFVDDDGNIERGKVSGEFINSEVLQEIKINNDDSFKELFVVANKEGVWLRQNTKVDRDTEDAELLEEDTMLIADSSVYTSNDNNYTWRKVIYYDGDQLKAGYMADDYLVNCNLEDTKGDKYIVQTKGNGLRVRDEANIKSEVIASLVDGDVVLRVPNHREISESNYDWSYIAYEDENGQVQMGYSAIRYRNGDNEYEYLKTIDVEENKEEQDAYITPIVVDTSSANGIDLNLRSDKSINSEIVAKIENNSTIFTSKDQIESLEEMKEDENGRKWIKVKIISGETGYVATEYVIIDNEKDKIEEKDNTNNIVEVSTSTVKDYSKVTFNIDNNTPGYFGIDTDLTIPLGDFTQVINGKYDFSGLGVTGVNNGDVSKPAFVYIKIGATGYSKSNYSYVNDMYTRDGILSYVRACEEAQIPYGFYYFSQSYSENDKSNGKNEVEQIESIMNSLDYKNLKYNVMPLGYDVEEVGTSVYGGRLKNYADTYGKSATTKYINDSMNKLRDDLGIEVSLYTAQNALYSIIDVNELDDVNKNNMWLCDYNNIHHDSLSTVISKDDFNNSKLRQVNIPELNSGTILNILNLDLDFVEENYYNDLVKDRLGYEVEEEKTNDKDNNDRDKDED